MKEIKLKFRDNLLHLRQQRNMTQEQLAMLLGVSRQSVAKWEAGQSTPEVDKLVRMAELFGCTLDELVSDDLSGRPVNPAEVMPEEALVEDVCGYDAHVRKFALGIAVGVGIIILGTAGTIFTGDVLRLHDAVAGIVTVAAVALGLVFILPVAVEHAAFVRAHPFVEDFYTDALKAQVRRLFIGCLVGGVGAILVGTCVLMGFSAAQMDDLGASLMMVFVAFGAGLLVYGGLRHGFANVKNYNRERADEQRERGNPRVGRVCGIIMLAATALGLLLLFGGMAASDAGNSGLATVCAYFWVVWPIGGIACGIATLAMKSAADK